MPLRLKSAWSTAKAGRVITGLAAAFLFLGDAPISLTPVAAAQSQDLDIRPYAKRVIGAELKSHFSAKTHAGAYNFNDEGKAGAFYTERHDADGSVFYKEGDIQTGGRWGVFNDILCYFYTDPRLLGGCYRVYRVENCYFFYSDNLPDDPSEIDGDFWRARSTLKGERQKCEAAIS